MNSLALPALSLARSGAGSPGGPFGGPGGGAGGHDRGERFGPRGGIPGILMLLGFLAVTLGLGAAMGQVTQPEIAGWYHSLRAPPLTPPDWVFGPVWTALYAMIGVAGWRVWLRRGFAGLGWWTAQLVLNAAWTPSFFAMHTLWLAVFVIAGLLLGILATIRHFWRTDRVAAGLMMPYLAWVTFAAWLNVGFAWLN